MPEHFQRHVHVAGGFQRGGEEDLAVPLEQGKGKEQAGDKLGADIPGKGEPSGSKPAGDGKRQCRGG